MVKYFYSCLFVFSCLICGIPAFAQNTAERQDKYRIGISNGAFIPQPASVAEIQSQAQPVFEGSYFKLVQLFEIPSQEDRKTWENAGLVLADYLPGNLYFATVLESFSWSLLEGKVRTAFNADARFKLEAELFARGLPPHAVKGTRAQLVVSYQAGLRAVAVFQDLISKGAKLGEHRSYSRQVDVDWDAARLSELVALPYVQFVGAILPPKINEADNLAYRNSSSRANYLNTGNGGLNYNGQGVVIDIGEGGTVNNRMDFKGRLTELVVDVVSDHKTGCSTNASGSGNDDPQTRSCAWGASILSTNAENYPNLITTHNARYFNHSYGFGIGGGYSSSSRDHDLRTATHPMHLVSYSSGNVGTDVGYAPYNFNNWGTITGAVKHNKNHLSVRNLSPNDEILDWGSTGPAYDGRLLPQITVSGPEGTSYASPKAVGTLAILEHAYKSTHAGTESPATLLKGILLNTADDMGNPGPDFKTGYGRPNSRRAYSVIANNMFLTSSVANGVTNSHNIVVPAGTRQVRVMLIWPDVAAAVNANPCIVNNLNLVGKNPSNTSYNPWVLDHTANPANLVLPAVRAVDNLNTVEQVTVDDPAAGTWSFEVSGASVPSGPQSYFLVYEFLSDALLMAYPLSNERFSAGDNYYIKWDSYGDSGPFTLEYRLNAGAWVTIVSNLDASKRSYPWTAPQVPDVQTIEFRVKRGGLTSASGINYIGSVPENVRVSVACGSSVTLKWSPVTGATSYKVYRLGSQYMEEVVAGIIFAGTSATLSGQSTISSEFYGVSAVTGTNEGLRSIAVEKTVGDVACMGNSWTGTVSTNWFVPNNWSTGAVPLSSELVSITSVPVNQPLIAAAGAVCGNITIGPGATLTMSSGTAYTLAVSGDWTNNGTFTPGIGTVDFAGTNGYQEIGGSSTTAFNILKITKATQANIVEATGLITLNAAANPLVLTGGTFKLSSASTITPFTTGGGAGLSSANGIWNNGGTINYGNFSWSHNSGFLKVSAGTFNAGSAANNTITYLNNPQFIVTGGTLNISGRIRPNSATSSASFNLQGGIINLNTVGSTSTTEAALQVNANASFNMSGGTLALQRSTSNTGADIIIQSTSYSVGGGTVQFGNASTPSGQTHRINSIVPVYNLTVNATNSPTGQIHTNPLTVSYNVTISGGTLNANNLNLSLGGNWTNNGTFTAGTGTVTLNGGIQQTAGGSSTTTFNNLVVNNSTGITLSASINVNSTLTLTSGTVALGNQNLTLNSASGLSGGNSTSYLVTNGTGLFRRTIGAAGTYLFPLGSPLAYNPATLVWSSAPGVTRLDTRYIENTASTGTGLPLGMDNLTVSSLLDNGYWNFAIGTGALTNNFNLTLTRNGHSNAGTVLNRHGIIQRANSGALWLAAGTWANPGTAAISPAGTGTVTLSQTGLSSFGEMAMATGIYCVQPTVPTVSISETSGLSSNDGEICDGASATLSVVSGNLNDATNWQWYSGSCGGTTVSTGTSINVNPGSTTGYFVRGEGGCATPGLCATGNITVNANPSTPTISASETTGAADNDGIICLGTGVTLNGPLGMSSYTWSHSGGSGQTSSLFSPSSNTTYSLTVGNAFGCTSTNTFDVQVINCSGATNIWKGISADWSNPANWTSGAAPNSCSETVIIPKKTFNPTVNAPVSVGDMLIHNQAGLVLNQPVSICGNLTAGNSQQAQISGAADLVFSGGQAQQVSGYLEATNLRINKSGGSTTIVNGKLSVTGTVSFPATNTANLVSTPSGNITLVSNAAGSARIGSILGGGLAGSNFTMERYVNGGAAGWYFIGTPVTAQVLGNWADDFRMVTPLTCAGSLTDANLERNTVYRHVETAVPANGPTPQEVNGWRAPVACNLTPGLGYRVFLNATFFGNGRTFENTGGLTSGLFNFNVTHTPAGYNGGGWNLMANPYPSNIDWDAPSGWTKSNLQNAVYTWVGAGNQYGAWVAGLGTNGMTGVLASGQAFFVRANASPALSIQEQAKTGTAQNMLRTAVAQAVLRIKANGVGSSDETIVHFSNQATDQFDDNLDAWKMPNTGVNLKTMGEGLSYSIQGFAPISGDKVVPLGLQTSVEGTYTLQFSGISTIEGNSVWLRDHYLNQIHFLEENAEIGFSVNGDANTQGDGRFELVFQQNATLAQNGFPSKAFRLFPNPTNGGNAILETSGEVGLLTVTDMLGKSMFTRSITTGQKQIQLSGPPVSGSYIVVFRGEDGTVRKVRWVVR